MDTGSSSGTQSKGRSSYCGEKCALVYTKAIINPFTAILFVLAAVSSCTAKAMVVGDDTMLGAYSLYANYGANCVVHQRIHQG